MSDPWNLLLPSAVTLQAIENAIACSGLSASATDGWHQRLQSRDRISIDLSNATWIDYSAAAQILTLVEGACRHGTSVEIRIPNSSATEGEARQLKSNTLTTSEKSAVARRIRQRSGLLTFLSHLGFFDALCLDHLRGATGVGLISLAGEAGARESVKQTTPGRVEAADSPSTPPRRILPFTWLPPPVPNETDTSLALDIARILKLSARGLTYEQSETIAREILWELIENVWNHAAEGETSAYAPPAALLGAISLNSRNSHYAPKEDDLPSNWETYSNWISEARPSLFRLVVADSGVSIQHTLGKSPQDRERWSPSSLPPGISDTEEAIFWSFAATSTRLPHTERRRGIRGLARVNRLVRWYKGAVLISSLDAQVGFANPPRFPKLPASRRRRCAVPGTLIDTHITGTVGLPEVSRKHFGAQGVEGSEVCALELTDEASLLADVESLTAGLGRPTLVLLCSAATLDRLGPEWVAERLADVAVAASTECKRVVLAAPEIEAQRLVPLLKAYEDAWSDESSHILTSLGIPTVPEPIMVLDSALTPGWWGGNERLRGRLYRLAQFGFLGRSDSDPALTNQHGGEIRSDWIGRARGAESLVPPVSSILDVLAAEATSRLENAFEQLLLDSESMGPHPTASGDLVNAWVDTGRALESCGAWLPFVSVALLQRMERSGIGLDNIRLIVSASDAVEDVGNFLSSQMGIPHQKLGGPRLPTVEGGLQGQNLLLVTDLVHTGYTIASDAIGIRKRGASIRAVLTVVRAVGQIDPQLELLGKTVPVISTVEIKLRTLTGSSRSQLPAGRIRETFDWSGVNRIIGHEWPVLLRHIVRSTGRHFSAYLDVKAASGLNFFSSPQRQQELSIADLVDSLDQGSAVAGSVEVWYPDDDLTAHIVASFGQALRRGLGWPVPLISVNRFDAIVRQTDAQHVVVFDWGAMTGRTLTNILLGAAATQAGAVCVYVLISQIPDVERRLLASVEQIRRPGSVVGQLSFNLDSDGVEALSSSVGVSFWEGVRLTLPSWDDESLCDLCALGRDLRLLEHYPTPSLVSRAISGRLDSLSPVSRQDAWEELDVDLFGTQTDSATVRQAIVIHQSFRGVHPRDPWDVVELRQMLANVRGSDDATAWVSTVMAVLIEPSLLKRAPLRVKSLRGELAGICLRIMHHGKRYGLQAGHYRQAAMVWRMVSKSGFLTGFPSALKRHLSSPDVVGELLLGVYIYLHRPYHQDAETMSRLLDQLDQARNYASSALNRGEAVEDVLEAIDHLASTAAFYQGTSESPGDTMSVWAQLKREYVLAIESHSGNGSAMEIVRELVTGAFVEGVLAGKVENSVKHWRSAADNWSRIRNYLASTVLPRVALLSNVLLSDYFRMSGHLGHERAAHLERIASSGHWESELADIGRVLEHFAIGAEIERSLVEELRERLNEWHATFFASVPGGESPLASILKTCPGNLGEALEAPRSKEVHQGGIRYSAPNVPSELSPVFVPTGLLQDLFGQLVNNVVAHRIEGQMPLVDVSVTGADHQSVVRFWNTASDPGNNPGRGAGLASYRERLSPFGGALRVLEPSGDYSFGVEVRMRRWGALEDAIHG